MSKRSEAVCALTQPSGCTEPLECHVPLHLLDNALRLVPVGAEHKGAGSIVQAAGDAQPAPVLLHQVDCALRDLALRQRHPHDLPHPDCLERVQRAGVQRCHAAHDLALPAPRFPDLGGAGLQALPSGAATELKEHYRSRRAGPAALSPGPFRARLGQQGEDNSCHQQPRIAGCTIQAQSAGA